MLLRTGGGEIVLGRFVGLLVLKTLLRFLLWQWQGSCFARLLVHSGEDVGYFVLRFLGSASWRIVMNFRLLSLMCRFIILLCAAYDKGQTEKEKNRFVYNVVILMLFAANLIFHSNSAIRGLCFNKVPRPCETIGEQEYEETIGIRSGIRR